MRILLYNPDNGVTRNFMPHLWMFLLQSLTPAGHEVLLIDGNAQPIDEAGIARDSLALAAQDHDHQRSHDRQEGDDGKDWPGCHYWPPKPNMNQVISPATPISIAKA